MCGTKILIETTSGNSRSVTRPKSFLILIVSSSFCHHRGDLCLLCALRHQPTGHTADAGHAVKAGGRMQVEVQAKRMSYQDTPALLSVHRAWQYLSGPSHSRSHRPLTTNAHKAAHTSRSHRRPKREGCSQRTGPLTTSRAALLWNCYGIIMVLRWYCYGITMVLL